MPGKFRTDPFPVVPGILQISFSKAPLKADYVWWKFPGIVRIPNMIFHQAVNVPRTQNRISKRHTARIKARRMQSRHRQVVNPRSLSSLNIPKRTACPSATFKRTKSDLTSSPNRKASRREFVGTGAGQFISYQRLLWLDLLAVNELKGAIPVQPIMSAKNKLEDVSVSNLTEVTFDSANNPVYNALFELAQRTLHQFCAVKKKILAYFTVL
ncbi:hypothetical protein ACFLXI_06140 [Chloroflexota bacterium]